MTDRPGRARRILPAESVIEQRTDGTIYARCPHPLGGYPSRLTDRLEHWARHAPDRTFLAERDLQAQWRRLTYADTLTRVRSVAQALLDRRLSHERPIAILSGNGIEHAILALASMYCGVAHAPVAPAYSLLTRDFATLRRLWRTLTPGLVFADDGASFARALQAVAGDGAEVVTSTGGGMPSATSFAALVATVPTSDVDQAHQRVGPETIAKILYTSGSTGQPKGVINTQRMLCANQEMLRTVLPLLAEEPPVLCDWLPWNHTFGGNHNLGLVLYNGGTLFIDAGRPTPAGFDTTVANLREIAATSYFNVPRGYELLVPRLRAEPAFREHFFSRMKMLFCAAASLRQDLADDLCEIAVDADGAAIPLVTGLGATESAPFALCAGSAAFTGGLVGVPVPGVELKLAPVGQRLEGRLRGPSITPGYWRDEALTAAAFDEEGFYRLGDALGFFDPAEPARGFAFEGRIAEDFKLSTGTWVRVGLLRGRILASLGDLALDVVLAGHDRGYVGALIFPAVDVCRALCGAAGARLPVGDVLANERVRARFRDVLTDLARERPGSSTSIRRAVLLEEPASIDTQELTDKGSISQQAVLARRAAIVRRLYEAPVAPAVLEIAGLAPFSTGEARLVGERAGKADAR